MEKKLDDVESFNNSFNNIKEMISYYKDKNNKAKNKYKKNTILKSFDTFNNSARISSSITFSLTGIGLIVIPITTASACALSIGKQVIYGVLIDKYNKDEKHYEKDQEAIKSSINYTEKLYKIIYSTKMNIKNLSNNFTKYVDETKNESFL